MYRLIVPVVLAALCSLNLTGCGIQASVFPVHETKVEYRQSEKPLYCGWFTCESKGAS